ncbi:MAG: hypothetical protein H6726_25065 [Sandaracinaceae bacterium]|nr:hypothetical protein [Sandaracinaceae bacterium]
MTRYRHPVLLSPSHRVEGFTCRSDEQTHWLQRRARQSANTHSTRVFVVSVHLVPELMPSPTDVLHLLLLMQDARRTLLGK